MPRQLYTRYKFLQSNESTGIHTLACSNYNTQTHQMANKRDHRCLALLLKPNKLRTSPTNLRALKNGIKCSKSLSVGSDIHPSIGIAFSFPLSSREQRTNLHAK